MDSRPEGLVTAATNHAIFLAARLRRDHAREILELGGGRPLDALRQSLAASLEAYAYAPGPGGIPLFMMGVGPVSPITRSAVVWLLGTGEMAGRPRGLLRAARWGLGRAFAVTGAECLEQFIPAWYAAGLRFVVRLGFAPEPVGSRPGGGDVTRVALSRERFMAVINP